MKHKLEAIIRNKFFQGGVFFTLSNFLIGFLNYLFNFLVGRGLGPQGYGEIAALFSYITVASIPISILSTLVIQKVSSVGYEKRVRFALSLEKFFWEKIRRWLGLFFLFLLLSFPLSPLTNLSPLTAVSLPLLIILSFLSTFYGALLQSLHLFLVFSLIGVLGAIIKLLGAIGVFIGIDGIITVITFIFLSGILPCVIYLKVFRQKIKREEEKTTKISWRLIRLLLNPQFIVTASSILALTFLNNLDIIFVKKFFPSTDAGIYSAWALFAKIILYVIYPLISITFIFFADETNKNQTKVFIFFLSSLSLFGIGSSLIYAFYPSLIIHLIFGAKFNELIPYLGYAGLFGFFYTAITFMNQFFLSKKSYFALILPAGIPIYIGLLFFLGKRIINIISLNIVFSSVISLLYLTAYVYHISSQKRKAEASTLKISPT